MKEKIPKTNAKTAAITKDTFMLYPSPQSFVKKLVVHIATIKPTVPHTRIGGKATTGSFPSFFRTPKLMEFVRPIVGI
ncbi:MAG: hypothetical protein BWX59_02303 [Bacteroidetes bacterium ADurb.Bin028]|nr:MAG: hypothetical protein BWX59_02303 [Bacteroidetes bacterium ADurb.Bin028]